MDADLTKKPSVLIILVDITVAALPDTSSKTTRKRSVLVSLIYSSYFIHRLGQPTVPGDFFVPGIRVNPFYWSV